jgi:two-component system chemotaxis response regulator CheY
MGPSTFSFKVLQAQANNEFNHLSATGGPMNKKILTVDDSATVRKLIQFALQSKEFQTIPAEDGLAALEVLKHERADAIVLDINMPRMNGLEFLQKIKSHEEYAAIPVVILTTEGQDEDREKAIALGASRYIIKPFTPSQLVTLLEEVLQGN